MRNGLNAYLDASALVPIFLNDPFSARMEAYLRKHTPSLYVSDFAAAEFVSALGLRIRLRQLKTAEAQDALFDFDTWQSAAASLIGVVTQDIRSADRILRRFDLGLRTPDALHIAVAQRLRCDLVSFDDRMIAAARTLGLSVAGA